MKQFYLSMKQQRSYVLSFVTCFFLTLYAVPSYSINYFVNVGESITIDPPSAASGDGYIDQVHVLQTSSALNITQNGDCSVKITVNSYFENTVTVWLRFVEKYTYAGHIGKVDHDVYVNITCKYVKPTSVTLPDVTVAVGSGADIVPTIKPSNATVTKSSWTRTGNCFGGSARQGHFYHVSGRTVGTGTVTVVLNDNDNLTASCKVTVVDPDNMPPTYVSLPESKTISVGGSVRLTPTLLPEKSSTTFRWSSDNESVATVDYGKVTGKKVGKANITVKTANGLTASCQVTVSSTGPFDDESDASFSGSIDGFDYVDLGLSVKWATYNVGASKPEDYGGYYAWGETSEKSQYKWETYSYGTYMNEVNIGNDIKGTKYDVAHEKWGNKWRMPTEKEFRELYNNCTVNSVTKNSVEGYEFIGNNGASIFLPSAGYKSTNGFSTGFRYWASDLSSTDPGRAASILITQNRYKEITASIQTQMRMNGMPIRPVTEATGTSTKQQLLLSASPSGGEVEKGTKVKLNADVTGADIYYTLDGSTPSKSSKYYSSAISINENCTLKAIAYKEGYYSSDVLTEYYTIKSSTIEPTSISVSPSSKTIKVGDTFTLSYSLSPSNATTNVTWSSDDTSIATVTSSGTVTGKKAGTTYINAKTSNGKTDYCKVTVEANSPSPSGSIEINATNFPDANFRNYLLEQSYGKDGVITSDEIKRITSINVDDKKITSLKGIEKFTALNSLFCQGNLITSLDVSRLTSLKSLYCYKNQLTALPVSNCTALEYLYCYNNQIQSLDVSRLTALKTLYCHHNQLTALSVSNCTALEYLYCYDNLIQSLDVSRLTALKSLDCHKNQLTALSLSNNTALENLWCSENQIQALDVSRLKALELLSCGNNQLTALSVSNNTALETLYCYDNPIQTLDVSRLTALKSLYCYKNQLTALSVSNNTALENLSCSDNPIQSLDVSRLTALKSLYCYNNQLTALSVSKNTALENLSCSDNPIQSLDVSRLTALKSLYCSNNQLTSLDVSNNKYLTNLRCYRNQIKDTNMDNLIRNLSIDSKDNEKGFYVIDNSAGDEGNVCTPSQVSAVKARGWIPYYLDTIEKKWLEYTGYESTGIKAVSDDEQQNAPIYDLSGKRLTGPRKGINIIGGKKVVVK